MKKIKKMLPWILIIIWMISIFYLSHQPAKDSNKLSKGLTYKITNIVEKINPNLQINIRRFNHLLRKSAHFFAYLLLGILLSLGLDLLGIKGLKAILIGLILSVIFAISDEFHQLFIPGRGGQVKDVLIDSMGALTGIILYKIVKSPDI